MSEYKLTINKSNNTSDVVSISIPKRAGTYKLNLFLTNGIPINAGTIIVDNKVNTYRLTLTLDNGSTIDCGTISTEIAEFVLSYLSVGNMKMNQTKNDIATYISNIVSNMAGYELGQTRIVLCPQTCLLSAYKDETDKKSLSSIKLSAQWCSQYARGAYTGQNSVEALKSVGAEYFLVGYSEVKDYLDNGSFDYKAQVDQVLANSGNAICCVGESKAERENGTYENAIRTQLQNIIGANRSADAMSNITIAYEPDLEIDMDTIKIREAITIIRTWIREMYGESVSCKVLFSGAVNATNASIIMKESKADGLLLGSGITLNAESFTSVTKIVDKS